MKRFLRGLGYVVGALVVARLVAALIWPTINDVTTGETPQYADLQPQRFSAPPDRVFEAALASARALDWEITGTDRDRREISAVATTPLFRFKDDVNVAVTPDGDGTTVKVRSHSRVGKGDLGANARRIRRFQADLAGRISPSGGER